MPTLVPTLQDHLAAPLEAGPPDVRGPLAVFPLFGPPPLLEYDAFATARGVAVKELVSGAAVNDLLVVNRGPRAVLLYEGELVAGAQQDRTLDVSVLVPAGAALTVPVSCVEHGRWDGARHAEDLAPAPHAAYPALRQLKNHAAASALAAGGEPRAAQGAVWQEVEDKAGRLGTRSATGAMSGLFEGREDDLEALVPPLHEGQCGTLAAIGGTLTVLDHVSRPEAFAALHGPLVRGYALDALEAPAAPAPSLEDAQAFLGRVLTARLSHRDGIGAGRDVRFAEPHLGGSGLVAGDELVQLTAFRVARPNGQV